MSKNLKSGSPAPFPALAGEGRGEGESGWAARRHTASKKAQAFRKNETDAERAIWRFLKGKKFQEYKFRRQHPIGPYFVDFVCLKYKLVVEIDGGQHCENPKDEIRTEFLQSKGFDVLRFWNNDVLQNMEGVLHTLSLTLSRKSGKGDIYAEEVANGPQ